MLRIRLRRVGKKKQPSFRMVIAESTAPRDGKFVEIVGFYNPLTEPATIRVKEERMLYWLSVGAQPSESMVSLLRQSGTMDRFARLKAGEPLEALVAEAGALESAPAEAEAVESEPSEPTEEEPAAVSVAEAEEPEEVAENEEAAEAEEVANSDNAADENAEETVDTEETTEESVTEVVEEVEPTAEDE